MRNWHLSGSGGYHKAKIIAMAYPLSPRFNSIKWFIQNPVAKSNCAGFMLGVLLAVVCLPVNAADDPITFRIGTGGSGGTYLPIGSLIAKAISGTNELNHGKTFYEPQLIALAQRSTGSVSNVEDINSGLLEAGLAQADVVHWAYNGTGPFENEVPQENLRGLATLYLESVHLIVRDDAQINDIHDLVGKRVSLDEKGSGTRLDMLSILDAYDLTIDSIKAFYLKTSDAIDRLRTNELDAIFLVAGYPVNVVSELVAEGKARVVPIIGPPVEVISNDYPFFSIDSIPANTYKNKEAIATLGVPAQMIINSQVNDELAYNITSMLWNPNTLKMLRMGHPKGNDVQLSSALTGMDLPLHPGAERYYREQGLLDDL